LRKNVLKFNRERDIKLYKKQRNKVNNMNKIAKENFENKLDNILLEKVMCIFPTRGILTLTKGFVKNNL
jgi:hypothetical protein